jgi:hypothetical protein
MGLELYPISRRRVMDSKQRKTREIREREEQIAQGSSPPPKLASDKDIFSEFEEEETDDDTDKSLDLTTTPPISPPTPSLIPIVTAILQPTPRRFPCCPFDLGLTVDGIIRTKQGQHISVKDPVTHKPSPFKPTTPTRHQDHDIDRETPSKPTHTSHLLKYNLHNLKMQYKRLTQKRARLMRAIRKTHKQRQQLQPTQITGKHTTQSPTNPSREQRKLFHPITIPETPPTQLHPDEPPL